MISTTWRARLPRFGGLVVATLALGVLVLSADPALAQDTYNRDHPILAYYYGWWEPEKLASWGIHQPTHLPKAKQVIGDTALVMEHIQQAQTAGIDGFIANSTLDLETLLRLGAHLDFRTTLQASNPSQVRAFYRYVDEPGLVTYQDHPVLFFWQTAMTSNAAWSALRNELDPEHRVLWIADGDKFEILAGDAWDGISPYAIAWSANPQNQLPAWGAKAAMSGPGKLYIPPVSPGCNDSPVRSPTCIQDRADGTYYQRTLAGALASHPQWAVVISTFNEWMEDTQIEPSVQEGDLFLLLTRDFAGTFKGPAPPLRGPELGE